MNYIYETVKTLKHKYFTDDPFELADCLNITLITAPLGTVWGMYKYIKRNKVIYINSDLNEYERRFVLAHELGHAVMHTRSSCFFANTLSNNKLKKEYQANLFAAELLVDLNGINNEMCMDSCSIDELAAYYKVPSELITFKFKEINL